MENKPSLRKLITKAKDGDAEATAQLVSRLIPLVKKYTHRLGYDDAYSELVTWIVRLFIATSLIQRGVRMS